MKLRMKAGVWFLICLLFAGFTGSVSALEAAAEQDPAVSGEAEAADSTAKALHEAVAQAASAPLNLKWSQKTVGKGFYSSIAIDPSGNTHIVYGDESKPEHVSFYRDLTHAWFDGKRWRSETVDTDVVENSSIAIDHDGGIHIAYVTHAPVTGFKLKYAYNGGSGWTTEFVEEGGNRTR